MVLIGMTWITHFVVRESIFPSFSLLLIFTAVLVPSTLIFSGSRMFRQGVKNFAMACVAAISTGDVSKKLVTKVIDKLTDSLALQIVILVMLFLAPFRHIFQFLIFGTKS